MSQDFLYWASGAAVLLVALGLLAVFRRLNRALRAMEELLMTTNEEMRETLPEVRGSVGNVNDITAAISLGVHAAEHGVGSSGRSLRSIMHGVGVGARSFLHINDSGHSAVVAPAAPAPPRQPQGDADVQ